MCKLDRTIDGLYESVFGKLFIMEWKEQSWKFRQILFTLQQQISNQEKKGMKILPGIREAVKMGDFFNSYQLLRFQGEGQYRTVTGGLISIGIIITIVIAFANMILDTVNRTTITYTLNSERKSDPPRSELVASPQGMFMFGVEVWGYNLSSEYRYFDVLFQQIESNYGDNYTYTPYAMEACTPEHWSMLPEMTERFDSLRISNWLCPTIGTLIKLGGKYSSAAYNQLSVGLYPCSNSTDPSRPCAPKEEIDAYIQAGGQENYFTFFYINSVVNADQPEYKTYFLQDRTYIVFSPQMGAQLDMYLKQTDIFSDNSIWPFEDIKEDTLYSIEFGPILYPFAVDNTTLLAIFYIMKDNAQQIYNRQVQKIFVVLSFMGGLIGAIMAGLFIINSYTSFAYEIALSIDVFRDNHETKTHRQLKSVSKGAVNIFSFLKYQLYSIIRKFKPDFEWPFMQYVDQCREEIMYQLDIKGLIKRLIFLQYAISYMLEDYHLAEMQQEKPILPSQVKKLREKIEAKQQQKVENQNESQSVSSNSNQNSNKPLAVQPDTLQQNIVSNNITTNEQCGSVKSPLEPRFNLDDKLLISKHLTDQNFMINIDDGVSEQKRVHNLRKIRESANMGNLISKKLLLEIKKKPNQEQQSSKTIELADIHPMPSSKQ